jgi:hypothetical protein
MEYLSLTKVSPHSSRYRFIWDGALKQPGLPNELLKYSLDTVGIQNPVLVHRLTDGSFHLVDGFKRAGYYRDKGETEIPCRVMSDVSLSQVLDIIVIEHFGKIHSSPASRAKFICSALELGIAKELAIEHYLPMLQLESHGKILKQCEKIGSLPGEILDFLEEKRFSIKQCVHMTRHPRELLLQLFSWKRELALTASIVEELLENIKDYLRANQTSCGEFAQKKSVTEILFSTLSPQEKTKRFRELVRTLRFPILTETNGKMDRTVTELGLPDTVHIRWDRTLEKKEAIVTTRITDSTKWALALETLCKKDFAQCIDRLLEEL